MKHKAGFVNIVGKPNVGKSTLMNKLLGEELSIVTPKAQTTRHRIKGIISEKDFQIIFSDTPGILKPAYKLHDKMMEAVDSAFTDADLVLLMVEAGDYKIDDETLLKIKNHGVSLFIVINKIDKSEQQALEINVAFWQNKLKPAEIIPVSALENFNLDTLLKKIVEFLPEHPPYYDSDEISDRNIRFFVSEIIRERILFNYNKEIPYSTEVIVESFKESDHIINIVALIFVMRESQKAIVLGHKGASIKKLGIESREKIEAFLKKKIFLDLRVKVSGGWRNDEQTLTRFGYNN